MCVYLRNKHGSLRKYKFKEIPIHIWNQEFNQDLSMNLLKCFVGSLEALSVGTFNKVTEQRTRDINTVRGEGI